LVVVMSMYDSNIYQILGHT